MTRKEAIARFNGIINAMSISVAQAKFYPSKAELDELCDMAIEALSQPIVAKHFDIQSGYIYCSPQIAENIKIVVRCKDCKNWRESHSEDEESYCYIDGRTTDSTDYCSWGERKEP